MTTALLMLKDPRTWAAICFALALLALGAQNMKLNQERAERSKLVADYAQLDLKRAKTHADELDAIRKKEGDHAKTQQEKIDELNEALKALTAARAADQRQLGVVRNSVATFSAGTRPFGETDAAAAGRFSDRLSTLGALAYEGASLVTEAFDLVKQRDVEVAFLKGVIANDRRACQRDAQ